MITAEESVKQVSRLAQMNGYPKGEKEALKELIQALRSAANLKQAEIVVSAFLDTAASDTRCPMPAEIRRACAALQEEHRPDPLCQICNGSGWRTITRGGYSGSERCKCWAPRPAPKMKTVPLPGQPGYVPDKPMPMPTEEDWDEARKVAAKFCGPKGDAA